MDAAVLATGRTAARAAAAGGQAALYLSPGGMGWRRPAAAAGGEAAPAGEGGGAARAAGIDHGRTAGDGAAFVRARPRGDRRPAPRAAVSRLAERTDTASAAGCGTAGGVAGA